MFVAYSFFVFFFKQKTAYEMRISDWSSDVCSSDLDDQAGIDPAGEQHPHRHVGHHPPFDGGAEAGVEQFLPIRGRANGIVRRRAEGRIPIDMLLAADRKSVV